jgi:chromosome segregation ATPase
VTVQRWWGLTRGGRRVVWKNNHSQNNELRKKLIDFAERMEAREAMHAKTLEAKSLECQLHEKRVEQEEHRVAEANLKVDAYMQQCEFLMKTEQELRSQLATYRDKFDGFQQMLTQSHDAFSTFKVHLRHQWSLDEPAYHRNGY